MIFTTVVRRIKDYTIMSNKSTNHARYIRVIRDMPLEVEEAVKTLDCNDAYRFYSVYN